VITFPLEAAAMLATFSHPNHKAYSGVWRWTHFPPTCNQAVSPFL